MMAELEGLLGNVVSVVGIWMAESKGILGSVVSVVLCTSTPGAQ